MNGVLAALASAVLFGASTPLAALLLRDAHPQMLAGLLYLGSGLGLGTLCLLRGTRLRLTRPEWGWLALAVLSGGALAPVLLLTGLARIGASSGSLLLNLEGVFTALLAWFVFHENFDRRIALGMLLILSGGALLSWQPGGLALAPGALFVAGACLGWAVDNNLTQKVSGADPLAIAALKGLVAGSCNLGLAALTGQDWPGRVVLTMLVGFFGYGVSLSLFVWALRHLGTARTGAYFSLAPFVGAALAVPMLHEPVTGRLLAAAGMMGIGLVLHLTERHEHEHQHEELEHSHPHQVDEHHSTAGEGWHRHARLRHSHPHYPDLHHRHPH